MIADLDAVFGGFFTGFVELTCNVQDLFFIRESAHRVDRVLNADLFQVGEGRNDLVKTQMNRAAAEMVLS